VKGRRLIPSARPQRKGIVNDRIYTTEPVVVDIWVNKLLFNGMVASYDMVAPGETRAFETGGLCPSGISGSIFYRSGALSMQSHSCLGSDVEYKWFTACCWNVNFKVVRKQGDDSTVKNNDYGFSLE